jgi:hypothetical protein
MALNVPVVQRSCKERWTLLLQQKMRLRKEHNAATAHISV